MALVEWYTELGDWYFDNLNETVADVYIASMQQLAVWRRPSCISGVGRCRKVSTGDQQRLRTQSAIWLRFATAP
jgi:formylglycine-generating enzyme required for sulfatase activity